MRTLVVSALQTLLTMSLHCRCQSHLCLFLMLVWLALKKAAENRKAVDPKTGQKKKVAVSIVEAFGGTSSTGDATPVVPVRDLDDVLRLEYRSKLLNPKWRDAMLQQGSGGAYEISQRMTAMIGWAATGDVVDNFVFDQANERYTVDEGVAEQLQKSNPEAFKNVIRRLLEAAGRGMWNTDEANLARLRDLYSDADDRIEEGATIVRDTSPRS
jgi:magnesium chelatase subunit H